eukprot:TRINITY_DN26027_c0_g1_i2.p1 TRINITY_DN26027_c0_g1~~TRINITY_DN26027_c0_g1_i2.p1  ORF type:complete len:206 (+),score=25.90 TRINITY_DN26027_c0_g1_i2:484-1101(+)
MCSRLKGQYVRAIAENRLRVVCAAASNDSGEAVLYAGVTNPAASTLAAGVVSGLSLQAKAIRVPVTTLDAQLKDLFHSGGTEEEIYLLKSDTQGHELRVLQGVEASLQRFGVRYFFVEFDPYLLRESGASALRLLRWFADHGMACRLARPLKCRNFGRMAGQRKCWSDLLCAKHADFVGKLLRCLPYSEEQFIGATAGQGPLSLT